MSERREALRDAAAALCGSCKYHRKRHRGQFITVNGQVYHYDGDLEYTDGSIRRLTVPCKAGPIQTLLDATEQSAEEGAQG